MFDAILFLAGAVLFFLAVLFFVFLWQDRLSLSRRREELQAEVASMKEQKAELDIWERELKVWANGLEREQLMLAQAREELRMLTASKQPLPEISDNTRREGSAEAQAQRTEGRKEIKNLKQDPHHVKL